MISSDFLRCTLVLTLSSVLAFLLAARDRGHAAELPLVRIDHGAFSEKIAIMWVGAEQGFFASMASMSK
jgi:hypothetical protein